MNLVQDLEQFKQNKWAIWSINKFPDLVEKYDADTWVLFPINVRNSEFIDIRQWFEDQDSSDYKIKTMTDNANNFVVVVQDYDLLLLFKLTWC